MPQALYTADEVLSPYVFVFYAAFIVSFVFTPLMRRVATFYNIIDKPDLVRKMHSRPVAYLGGVAVFLGWLAGVAISQTLNMHRDAPGLPHHVVLRLPIIGSAVIILMLGLFDDLKNLSPYTKIAGQVAAAGGLILAGVGTRSAAWIILPIVARMPASMQAAREFLISPECILVCSSILVVMVVVFCCNATNLMDGLDGLCGGVTAIVALGFVLLAVQLGRYGGGMFTNWDAVRVVLGLALLGGVLGFVPYNFNPASIFMGDTGSMFLGFSCATLILLMADAGSKYFLAAMVMFALPVLDTSLAFARRWLAGRPVFSADKMHFHHQLVQRGLTVRKAVLVSYALAIGFMIMGSAIVFMRTRYVVGVYLVVFGCIVVAAYKMGMVHERPQVIARPRPLGPDDAMSSVPLAPRAPAGGSSSVLEIREDEKTGA
jgi:UDP-GlcNAc:undecaprenyl-phosphate GlcNAc-1-phosphate transferase